MLIYETHLPITQPIGKRQMLQIAYNWLKKHPILQTAPHVFMTWHNEHGSVIYPIQCILNPDLYEEISSIRFRIPHPNQLPCDFVISVSQQPESWHAQLKLQLNKDKNAAQNLQFQMETLQTEHAEQIAHLKQEHQREIQTLNEKHQFANQSQNDTYFHDMKEKNQEISDLKHEIRQLEQLLEEATQSSDPQHSYTHVKTVVRGSCVLAYGDELDLYNDEILSFVRDALHNELATRTHENSRRQHILQDLLLNNALETDLRKEKESELKRVMRNYQRLDAPTLNALKKLGFSHTQDGTHHKFKFMGDERYVATTSKSSSDVRSGKNFAHDIANKLF